MSKHDDGTKLAKPLKAPVTVSFKKSRKNAFNTDGGKTGRKNALNQQNEHELNPEQSLIRAQTKPRKAKAHKVDPYMVRQAKLKAKQAAQDDDDEVVYVLDKTTGRFVKP